MKKKEIKLKAEDQKLFEELLEDKDKIEQHINILTEEIGILRRLERQHHETVWDIIHAKYKLSDDYWCYDNKTKKIQLQKETYADRIRKKQKEEKQAEIQAEEEKFNKEMERMEKFGKLMAETIEKAEEFRDKVRGD